MSVEDFIVVVLGMFVLGAIVIAANYADRRRSSNARWAVTAALILINILLIFNGVAQVVGASPTGDGDAPAEADASRALVVFILTAVLATLVLFQPVAERLAAIFPRFRGQDSQPLAPVSDAQPDSPPAEATGTPLFPQMLDYYTTGSLRVPAPAGSQDAVSPTEAIHTPYQARGFNPASMVHRVAVVFVCYLLGVQFANFILGGGLEGVAELYEEGLSGWDLLLNSVPFVLIPLLGVGFGIRRNLPQTLQRLGLGFPTGQGLLASIGITIGLFVFVASVAYVWMNAVPEEVFEEQSEASDALSDSVTTVGLALLLAATAAIGEEIAFRGALQPVIGFWATAVIFSLTHIQYTLTPAWLIIFGVALAFGWIRQRYNTTVAIMTHFLYNFIPLALTVSAPDEAWVWVVRLF